jgi:hypothetical protein
LQISGMSFTLTKPRRLCLFRVLDACPFCFLQYTALPACCNCSPFLFTIRMALQWSVPHFSCCYSIPLSKHTRGGGTTPAFSCLFSLREGMPLPHFLELRAPHPLCYMSFFFQLLVYYSVCFFLFSLGGSQSVQGAMLICPRVVCGSTTCHLFAHLVVCISQAG